MLPIRRTARIALVPAVALMLALAGCGTSKVVREGGAAATRASAPKPGQTVTVRKGDNLYRLAVNNGISPLDLAMWNGIRPLHDLSGQRLRLYRRRLGRQQAHGRTSTASSAAQAATRARHRHASADRAPTQAPPQPTARHRAAAQWRGAGRRRITRQPLSMRSHAQGIGWRFGVGKRACRRDGVVVYSAPAWSATATVIIKHDEQCLSALAQPQALGGEGDRRARRPADRRDGPHRRRSRHAALRDPLQRQAGRSAALPSAPLSARDVPGLRRRRG